MFVLMQQLMNELQKQFSRNKKTEKPRSEYNTDTDTDNDEL